MTPAGQLRKEASVAISRAAKIPPEAVDALLEKPPQGIAADLAFPCFSLSKTLKKKPPEIAATLAAKVKPAGLLKTVAAAGPYLNLTADWGRLGGVVLRDILARKGRYGAGAPLKEAVVVEFAHPNTHKAFHIGHVRNITLGESLSRLLQFAGHRVVRANYQGDIGPHVAACLWGLMNLGMRQPREGKGAWLGEVYAAATARAKADAAAAAEVRTINRQLYAGDDQLRLAWEESRQWSLEYFAGIYRDFGVVFDRFYFESEVEAAGVALARSLLAQGVAQESEGAIVMDLEQSGLGVYVLLTREGTPLYSVKDIVLASFQDKEFNPSRIIHVVGSEQTLHFRQLFKSLELISPAVAAKEVHLAYGLVTLPTGKMSSREGNVVTYDRLLAEVLKHALRETRKHTPHARDAERVARAVALGAIKYDMLKQSPEKTITFDWDQALSFEGNAAPYLQYTHARACSILRKAKAMAPVADAKPLVQEKERLLLSMLLEFPETVQRAARDCRPHYLANYAYGLASAFNDFYQNVPVLKAGKRETSSRLALVQATQHVLSTALGLMGVEAVEKM